MNRHATFILASLLVLGFSAQAEERERGPGQPTSMFGTYIAKGDLIVYPFFEYYLNGDEEYSPNELGYGLDEDYEGSFRGTEELLFIGYGFTDRLAVEFEMAMMQATLEKANDDPSAMPQEVSDSGLGDVEGQFRYTWNPGVADSWEKFSYLEVVFPTVDEGSLIGTSDWEFKLGSGAVRQFSWGTFTTRLAVEYDNSESKTELGEIALEWMRRFSPKWQLYLGLEGTQDEWEGITDLQWFLSSDISVRINNAFGITPKATDYAPEIGIVFRFPG